jgi:hypothetical protein
MDRYLEVCLPSIETAIDTGTGPFASVDLIMIDDTGAGMGRSAARNVAIEQSRQVGIDWLFFLDADDLMAPSAFKVFGDVLNETPKIDGVWGQICCSTEDGQFELRENQAGQLDSYEGLLSYPPVNAIQIGAFVRTDVAARYGFDESMNTGEDFKFYYQIWKSHTCAKVPHVFFMNVRGAHSTGARSATGLDWVKATNALWAEAILDLKNQTGKTVDVEVPLGHDTRSEDAIAVAKLALANPLTQDGQHLAHCRIPHGMNFMRPLFSDLNCMDVRMIEVGDTACQEAAMFGSKLRHDSAALHLALVETGERFKETRDWNLNANGVQVSNLSFGDLSATECFEGKIDIIKIDSEAYAEGALTALLSVIERDHPIIIVMIHKQAAAQFVGKWGPRLVGSWGQQHGYVSTLAGRSSLDGQSLNYIIMPKNKKVAS